MDRNLALELVRVTEAAALASARFLGKGDPHAADSAAVTAMEIAFHGIKIDGRVVIGDDDTPEDCSLRSGGSVGEGGDVCLDLVVDPLESKHSLADGQANAISAIAIGQSDSFYAYRHEWMEKIAVGPDAALSIDLSASVFDNLVKIAEAKRVYVEDLTVAILDRERHRDLIAEVRKAGARIELCRDGDLASSIAAALPGTGIDVAIGTGDSRRGILTAAALSCLGGGFQARFRADKDGFGCGGPGAAGKEGDEERDPELEKIFTLKELAGTGSIMFAMTGVSHSDVLEGVLFRPGGATTHSLVFRGKSGTIRTLKTEHFFDKDPDYT